VGIKLDFRRKGEDFKLKQLKGDTKKMRLGGLKILKVLKEG